MATEDYRNEQDTLADFLEDRCILDDLEEVSKKALHDNYLNWSVLRKTRAMSKPVFGSRLIARGTKEARRAGGRRVWLGIGLRNQPEPWEVP